MRFHSVAFLLLAGVGTRAQIVPDCGLVPGWAQQGPARSYVAENLFEYMDGNAEGYLIYHFVRMNGVTCKSGEKSILIDVSEMDNPESAYGIFASNRDPAAPVEKIGMSAQIQPRRAIFAKGKYYVELAANPEGDYTATLKAFALGLEKRIPGTTHLPATIGWFPKEKLLPGSIRLVPQSVLGMSQIRRGFVAEYEFGKAFIAAETSPEAASAVLAKVKARVGEVKPVQVADEAFEADSRYLGKVCFFRKGSYLAGYVNLAAGQDAVTLASALASRIP
jgi:hypothetical protein